MTVRDSTTTLSCPATYLQVAGPEPLLQAALPSLPNICFPGFLLTLRNSWGLSTQDFKTTYNLVTH